MMSDKHGTQQVTSRGRGGRGKRPFHFPARYAGICACCGKDFAAGTVVQYDGWNKLVIVECTGVTAQ